MSSKSKLVACLAIFNASQSLASISTTQIEDNNEKLVALESLVNSGSRQAQLFLAQAYLGGTKDIQKNVYKDLARWNEPQNPVNLIYKNGWEKSIIMVSTPNVTLKKLFTGTRNQ